MGVSKPPSCSDIKWGDYEPLTFWRKLKLGTAYYVNPDTAGRASVSYVYSPSFLKDDPAKAKQVWTAVEMGDATLAQKKPDGDFFIASSEKAKKAFGEMQPTSYDDFLTAKGYFIAATSDDLAGVKPTRVVVSFNPTSSCPQSENKDAEVVRPK